MTARENEQSRSITEIEIGEKRGGEGIEESRGKGSGHARAS